MMRKELAVEKVIYNEVLKDQDREPVRIGNFTLEQLATTMSNFLTDEDWTNMKSLG